jgi:hypothetical protein
MLISKHSYVAQCTLYDMSLEIRFFDKKGAERAYNQLILLLYGLFRGLPKLCRLAGPKIPVFI